MTTMRQLLTGSLRLINAVQANETPTDSDMDISMSAMNALIDSMSNDILNIHTFSPYRFPLVAGQSQYTLGPAFDINGVATNVDWSIPRPMRIEQAKTMLYSNVTPSTGNNLGVSTDIVPPPPPTCEIDPYFANVSLLLNFDGSPTDTDAFDGSSFAEHMPFAPDQSISNTDPLFGTGSLRIGLAGESGMNWTGTKFSRDPNEPLTIEASIRAVSVVPVTAFTPTLWDLNFGTLVLSVTSPNTPGTVRLRLDVSGAGSHEFDVVPAGNGVINTELTVSADNVLRFFVEGVQIYSVAFIWDWGFTWFMVGGQQSTFIRQPIEVYMDRVRYTKGIARHVANFTPPTMEPCNGNLP